jgi:phosphatidylglycerol---prolipoprotein diacylglyceryl transferase
LILPLLADALNGLAPTTSAIRYDQLGISPTIFEIGWFKLRWYSVSYIVSILVGWWYMGKLIAQPGAPMAKRHIDDFVFYATLGVILGGRLGYCLFYKPELFLTPLQVLKLWEGGMSLHGGVLGVIFAIFIFTRKHKLNFLRVCDYISCATPFGLFLVRIANFMNGELWGGPSTLPWAVIFPGTGDEVARHPSQLYEAGLEGLVSMAILYVLFWKTDARYYPGRLMGTLALTYGVARFSMEFIREPDPGVYGLFGMSMGQTLSVPLIVLGLFLLATSKSRRNRVEPVAGTASIA